MGRTKVSVLAALVALLLGIAPFASAQVTTGSLQGVVQDENKASVAGATIKVTNVETGITKETSTNEEGFYRITNLQPGNRYRIEVSAGGFAPSTLDEVAVRLGTENNADVVLGVAKLTSDVVVTGEQPLIQSTQNQLSQTFTPKQLTQLPIIGSIDNLALLTPGVVTPGDTDYSNGVGISANGNRGRSNNFQIDGQDNNDNSVGGPSLGFTNTEAIGEYQVITNNFSAEFGRNSGAQINTITKAGTNDFHGSLFEYHNNSALDARTNIDKKSAAAYDFLASKGFNDFAGMSDRFPNSYRDNRFGGALGGPIVKNKAFFFGTYQRDVTRGEAIVDNLQSGSFTMTPQSAQLAARLFPNAATAAAISTGRPGGPTTAQGMGQFIIAPPTVDTNGDGIPDELSYDASTNFFAPLAIAKDANGNLVNLLGGEGVRIRRNNATSDQFITRFDFNLTDKDTILARLTLDRNILPLQAGGSSVAGSLLDYRDRSRNFGITYTRTLSSSTVNEARFNYANSYVTFGDTSATDALPFISFTGNPNLSGVGGNLSFGTDSSFPQSRKVVVYQVQDTISTTIGNHALKFGADIRAQRVDDFFLPFFLGGFSFAGSFSSLATAGTLPAGVFFDQNGCDRQMVVNSSCQPVLDKETGKPTFNPASSFENFLMGRPRTINFTLGDANSKKKQDDYFFFVQDDYRIRPNLTLNLGLRYEISTQPLNSLIEQLNARESDPNTALFDPKFPIDARTLSLLPTDKNNFAPRVGFAWSPNFRFLGDRFADGHTVVRGGFGISYDPAFFNMVSNTVTSAPFVARGQFIQAPGGAGSVTYPFLPGTTAELNTTPSTNGGDPRLFSRVLVDPNFHNPYAMNYNFGVQQELYKNGVLEVRYVGTRLVGQFQNVNSNPQIDFLNAAGTALGLGAGAFTNGVIGEARPGTNGNGRIDSDFGRTLYRTNGGTSTYNGLQVRFDTRFGRDLVLNANYTWSKTIDNTSEVFSSLGGGQTSSLAQNPFDISSGERGRSAFDQRHNFTANFTYELPYFREQKGVVGHLLGGYQVNGIVRLGSGRPYTPYEAFGNFDPLNEASLRPFNGNPDAANGTIAFGRFTAENMLGYSDAQTNKPGASEFVLFNTNNSGSGGTPVSFQEAKQQARLIYNDFGLVQFFGTGVLSDLEAFRNFKTPYGDVGRNTFSGLPFYRADLGIFKTTNLTERTKLELRAEVTNLFNHRNYGVPDAFTEDAFTGFAVGSYQNPGYNVGSSRSVRLGLRLLF